MVQFVHHPAVWRYRAALTRVAAEHGVAVGSKEHELKLAAFYERLARYAEERVSCERARRRLLPAPSRAGLIAGPGETDRGPSTVRVSESRTIFAMPPNSFSAPNPTFARPCGTHVC